VSGVVLRRGWEGGEENGGEKGGERGEVVLHQVEGDEEELVAEAHSEEDWLWVEGKVSNMWDEQKGGSVEDMG